MNTFGPILHTQFSLHTYPQRVKQPKHQGGKMREQKKIRWEDPAELRKTSQQCKYTAGPGANPQLPTPLPAKETDVTAPGDKKDSPKVALWLVWLLLWEQEVEWSRGAHQLYPQCWASPGLSLSCVWELEPGSALRCQMLMLPGEETRLESVIYKSCAWMEQSWLILQ